MKNALILGVLIAVSIAVFTIFHFVHPVLVLTLGDIFLMIVIDVCIAFFLACYLGESNNTIAFWTIIGSACLIIPIIAALIKYNVEKGKKL